MAFSQDDAFPVIARLIRTIHQGTGCFVSHSELVTAFLDDPVGQALIQSARHEDPDQKSIEWWASNMIQWFSQRITEGMSDTSRFSNVRRSKEHGPIGLHCEV